MNFLCALRAEDLPERARRAGDGAGHLIRFDLMAVLWWLDQRLARSLT